MYSIVYEELKKEKLQGSCPSIEEIHAKLNNPSKILSKLVATVVLDYCKEHSIDHSAYLRDNGKSASVKMSSLPEELRVLLYKMSLHLR